MIEADAIVIGAGVVGLACAAELARNGHETIIAEAAGAIGTGTSSRNSEVIHAGLYYKTGSLKHLLCVEGRRSLYDWLETRGVAHRKTGKLVVATSTGEAVKLEGIQRFAEANGVEGLRVVDGNAARQLEPNLRAEAALLSPETGIVDSHGYMLSLQGAFEDHGGAIAFNAPVEQVSILPDGRFALRTGGADPAELATRILVNAAGLHAMKIARRMDGYDAAHLPHTFTLAKGNYVSCAAAPAFSRLIYPVPQDGGLGIHLTLDLGGRMRFGPDVEWLGHDDPAAIDYPVLPDRIADFEAAIRTYWPGLPAGSLQPDYAGVRPKLAGPGEPAADFRIDGPAHHGLPGLVHLFGIESPGLTSSLAIAREVARQLGN